VRRWIRGNKLHATQESRKGGNIISEQTLLTFLKSSPKYAGVAATLLMNPIGLTTAATAIIGGIITDQYIKAQDVGNAHIRREEVIRILKADIVSKSMSVKKKQDAINQLEEEIKIEQKKINDEKSLLHSISKNSAQQNGIISEKVDHKKD
jgi:hypothetical protein